MLSGLFILLIGCTQISEETHSKDTKWQDELENTNHKFENETGRIWHQETEDGKVVILYDK